MQSHVIPSCCHPLLLLKRFHVEQLDPYFYLLFMARVVPSGNLTSLLNMAIDIESFLISGHGGSFPSVMYVNVAQRAKNLHFPMVFPCFFLKSYGLHWIPWHVQGIFHGIVPPSTSVLRMCAATARPCWPSSSVQLATGRRRSPSSWGVAKPGWLGSLPAVIFGGVQSVFLCITKDMFRSIGCIFWIGFTISKKQ